MAEQGRPETTEGTQPVTADLTVTPVPPLGFRGLKVQPPPTVRAARIFVSSPGDCADARLHVRQLVRDAVSLALSSHARLIMHPLMWEDAVAQIAPGQTLNDLFVEKAMEAELTLVL